MNSPQPRRLVMVPSPLLLLPEYAGRVDPVPDLRAAVAKATAALGQEPTLVTVPDATRSSVVVGVVEPIGVRVGRSLVVPGREVVLPDEVGPWSDVLLVADGSARRQEVGGPGLYDARAAGFDQVVADALAAGDTAALAALDDVLAADLLVNGLPGFHWLGGLPEPVTTALDWSGAPYGVGWFVATWTW